MLMYAKYNARKWLTIAIRAHALFAMHASDGRMLTLLLLRYPHPAFYRQYALDHHKVRTIDHWRIPHLPELLPI